MQSFLRYPNYYAKIYILFFLSSRIRMSGKSVNFGDKRANKSNFYKNRKLFKIDNIDADKILVSRKNHMS